MFLRLLWLSAALGLFAVDASAGLLGYSSGLSRVKGTPVYVRLNVSGLGTGTGVAIVRGERIVLTDFSGQSVDGEVTVDVSVVPGKRPYVVDVTIGDASKTFRLSPKPDYVPFAGEYTLYAPGNLKTPKPEEPDETPPGEEPEVPSKIQIRPKLLDGHGIGIMHVSRKGLVRTSLHLADGTRMSAGGVFDSLYTVPLSAISVKAATVLERGLVRKSNGSTFAGTISLGSTSASDGVGLFRWTRKRAAGRGAFFDGFDFHQPVAISRYKSHSQPLRTDQGPQGRATLKGGPLTRNVQAPITFDDGNLKASEFELTSKLNSFSGHFSGTVRLPILDLPARAAGIVFLKHNRIYGMATTPYGSTGLTIEADNEHEKD